MSSSIEQLESEDRIVGEETIQSSSQTSSICLNKFKGLDKIFIFVSLLSSALLFAFDQTVTADSQEGIIASLNALGEIQWISVPFLLGSTVSRSLWIKLYSSFNIRNIYLIAILIFCLGSIICGTALTMNYLVAGRTVSGIGGSGMYIGALKLFTHTSTDEERSQFFGMPGLTWGLATILGPIVGEAFSVSRVGWRFSFYIDLLVCAVFTPALFLLPSSTSTEPTRNGPLQISHWIQASDPIGTILLSAIYLTGLITFSIGGIACDWTDPRVLLLILACGFLVVIYSSQQTLRIIKTPQNITVPDFARCLKNSKILFAWFTEACASTSVFVTVYFIPLYLELLYGKMVVFSSLHILPLLASMIMMVIVSGTIITRHGNSDVVPWLYGFGGLLIFVGGSLLITVDNINHNEFEKSASKYYPPAPVSARIYAATILIEVGAGLHIQLPFAILPTEIPQGLSLDLISYAQLAIPAVMLSFADTVYNNRSIKCVNKLFPNVLHTEIQRLVAGGSIENSNSSNSTILDVVKECVGKSIGKLFILVAVMGGLTIASTLLMYAGSIWPAARSRLTPP